jgi:small subunit ribosomal protein S6
MAYYEIIYIVRADLTNEQIEQVINRVRDLVTANGGSIHRTELWGRRQLAYPIKKSNKGFYVFQVLEGQGTMVGTIEARMRIDEDIMKFQTIRIEALPERSSPLSENEEESHAAFQHRSESAVDGMAGNESGEEVAAGATA